MRITSKKKTKRERDDDSDEKKLKRRRSRAARAKGHTFERECAIMLREFYPDARRLLENHRDDARGVDLLHTGRLRIQCKRRIDYSPVSTIAEIQCDELIAGEIPLLVTSGDGKRPMVVLSLSDFIAFLRDLQAAGTLP